MCYQLKTVGEAQVRAKWSYPSCRNTAANTGTGLLTFSLGFFSIRCKELLCFSCSCQRGELPAPVDCSALQAKSLVVCRVICALSSCLWPVSSHIRARLPRALCPSCCLSSVLCVILQRSEKCLLLQSTLGFILLPLRVCAVAGRGCQEFPYFGAGRALPSGYFQPW